MTAASLDKDLAMSSAVQKALVWYRSRIQSIRWTEYLGKLVATDKDGASSSTVQNSRFSSRTRIASILGRPDGGAGLAGQKVRISGWVKTGRGQGKGTFAFLEVNDGSCAANLQVMVDASVSDLSKLVATGTCLTADGCLKIPPKGKGTKQKIELRADKVTDVGTVDPATYPLPKTNLSQEYLRDITHFRIRTKSCAATVRTGSIAAKLVDGFFDEELFTFVHTPIITTCDCEGGGETFQVTTLIKQSEKLERDVVMNIEAAKLIVEEKGEAVAQLKAAKASLQEIAALVAELDEAEEALAEVEEIKSRLKPGLPYKDGKIDYSKDFFCRPTFLTVSGQFQLESCSRGIGDVYTFGPTFRAEKSHTSRHLSEFRMVEAEIAFAGLEELMNCAEAFVKYICNGLLEKGYDDLKVLAEKFDKDCIDRLKVAATTPFGRVTYTEAIKLLEEAVAQGKTFEKQVEWGIDLASEHERYLTEVLFQKPLIVYNYPKEIKPFYMRLNDDGKTVGAMDVLVPKVGELIGGSEREERFDVLMERVEEMGLSAEQHEWYTELRRQGTANHSGFGMGFERMLLFATGIDNIRDVSLFPRYPGRADL
ncbi:unnamed protein product [Thlaspi arvense]|uniref:asparagine--tRNA ligase n=1 Tax=Thlaspi arvense TaxID=13288 RepID=A0AAU9S7M2_THLAR|nr:unnamed protein product [Thlaspi arvense]